MLYALISEKDLTKRKWAGAVLSLSKKVIVFKSKKEPRISGKLVRIFQKYTPPKGFKIEEITSELYERAPGFEEIKAMILDELFAGKKENKILFGLSFYDFEYLKAEFVNALGKRIKNALKKQGLQTKFIQVQTKPYLSKKKSQKLKKEGLEIVVIKKSSPPLSIYLGKVVKCN